MFDSLPTDPRDEVLTRVRSFFSDHGHGLANAASLLGGASAEARVMSCAIRLETARRIDRRIERDLIALHRLLSLENVGDPDSLEAALFAMLDPATPDVDRICWLTDRLDDLLRDIDVANQSKEKPVGGPRRAA